jgi:hypothetical protein
MPCGVSNHGDETSGPCKMQQRAMYAFTHPLLLTYHAFYIEGYSNHIQNGSHDYRGPTNAKGSKAKPAKHVRDSQSNQSKGRSDTRGGHQLAHPEPHRGDPVLSRIVSESRSGGFLHTPLWATIEPSRFFAQITREGSVKPPGLDLIRGALAPA